MKHGLAFAAAALALCLAAPAPAQKAKDTLRAALYQPIEGIDDVLIPGPEAALLNRPVAEYLLYYETESRAVAPLIASSWKRVDDTTLELALRRDVKFHDGSPLDADDVVYSVNYVIDPKENFRFKESRFGWIAGIEKIDAYTVRVRAVDARATMLARLTIGPPIYPSDVHGALSSKAQFARRPVGTGPYRVTAVDATKGVVLERHAAYAHGGAKPAARIGRIEVSTIGDLQTQVARLVTGQQDFVYNVELEQARSLAADPALRMLVVPTIAFAYIDFDAADRSGIRVFKDKRVREAILRAIDRPGLRRALLPNEIQDAPMLAAMCHPWVAACTSSLQPPAYDPAAAKRLLVEAGLADGFDLTISAWGPSRRVAEAVAGQLRAVGVRASVEGITIGVWQKKRADGKLQATVNLWDNAGGAPDVESTTNFFYIAGSTDYYMDSALQAWSNEGVRTLDAERRRDVYRRLFDRVIAEHYSMPVMELPAIIVHHKDVVFEGGHKKPEGFEFHRIRWTN